MFSKIGLRGGYSRPLPAALLLAVVAQALFLYRLTIPHKLVFDEVHYVPAARKLWALAGPANIEHPLLGKVLIGLGIAIFGDDSLGWRAMSSLAGTATVLGLFAIGWLAFGTLRAALLASVLGLVNITLYIQARIAMLDGFMAAFVIGGVAALLWSMRAPDGRRVATRWALGTASLGLAVACKWTALPYLAFASAALLYVRVHDVRAAKRPLRAALSGHDQPHWSGLRPIRAIAFLWFGAGVLYFLSFGFAFLYADDALTWRALLPFQLEMFRLQTQVLPAHTYQSAWWSWPLVIRPIWYLYEPADGAQRGVLMLGNPAVMWGGLVGVAACGWAWWRERSMALGGAAALWLGGWGMWALIPKSLGFFYYYYLPSLWLPVAIAAACHRYARGRLAGWDEAFAALAIGLFIYFFPIISAAPLSGPQAFQHWMWFSTWP